MDRGKFYYFHSPRDKSGSVRASKTELLVKKVNLMHTAFNQALARFSDGREPTALLRDIAPTDSIPKNR